MHDPNEILVERDGSGIVHVVLNRPHRKNAVTAAGWAGISETFLEIADRPEDRCVVLSGTGDTFCAGADLSGASSPTRSAMQIVNASCAAIRDLPKPTIAAVSGAAVGAGFSMALACDLLVADSSARFSMIFVKRGLSPDYGGSWFLTHATSLQRAKEIAFFGDEHTGAQLHEFGIVNRITPEGGARETATRWAGALLELAPGALSQTKQLLNSASVSTLDDALQREATAQGHNMATQDTAEAISAFLEKRPARFVGR
jgi:enoyl-CoA hydratase/carnithine racemase